MQKLNQTIVKQKGAVLILMAFIIGLGALAYLLYAFDPARLRLEQDKRTMQTLNEAKQALIAWAVSHPNHPGIMPFPDRNDDLPQGYDDKSDCVTAGVAGVHLIGKLPVLSDVNCVTPHVGLSIDGRDAAGERLWYSVSINLVRMSDASTIPVINPSIVNSPSQPWFLVRDRSGAIISDRVAAVILSPGAPVGTQDRSGGIADANQYLDKIVMADGTPYKNYGYPDPATTPIQDFIVGDDTRKVAKNDPTYKNQSVEPYYFNDKLVYITIDELMVALSARAAATAKTQLLNYKNATASISPPAYYPYASALVIGQHYQKNAQYTGFLPADKITQSASQSCSVNYASANLSSSSCASTLISNVEFTRTSGTFTLVTGSECTRTNANRTCTCAITSGTSSCGNASGTRKFTCGTSGCFTTNNLPGKYVFNGAFNLLSGTPAVVKPNSTTGICAGCGTNTISCSSATAANGSFSYDVTTSTADFNDATTNSVLPLWFTANSWQDYLFYGVSSNCVKGQLCDAPDIVVGDKLSVQAAIIATGSPIINTPYAAKGAAQTHNGCDVKEYLDSTENTNVDIKFEPNNKQRTAIYNDQTFVVSP